MAGLDYDAVMREMADRLSAQGRDPEAERGDRDLWTWNAGDVATCGDIQRCLRVAFECGWFPLVNLTSGNLGILVLEYQPTWRPSDGT